MDRELGTRIYVLAIALLVVALASGCASVARQPMEESYRATPQQEVDDAPAAFARVFFLLAEWMLTPATHEKPAPRTKRHPVSKPVVVVQGPPPVYKRRKK